MHVLAQRWKLRTNVHGQSRKVAVYKCAYNDRAKRPPVFVFVFVFVFLLLFFFIYLFIFVKLILTE